MLSSIYQMGSKSSFHKGWKVSSYIWTIYGIEKNPTKAYMCYLKLLFFFGNILEQQQPQSQIPIKSGNIMDS